MSPTRSLSWPRRLLLLLALILILISWWQVLSSNSGLLVRRFQQNGLPLQYMVAAGAPAGPATVPGVLIAHGFSGSRQLMLGYGYALAHSGYAVMLWDFSGHGANPNPLEDDRDALQNNLDSAYAALLAQPAVDPDRVALLGHSMGSGAVMQAAVRDPERYAATVAVSPTSAPVSPTAPRNFLLTAGTLEARFLANAEDLLTQAGGANDDFAAGLARDLVPIPNAEHISILFRWLSHDTARDWLDATFGIQRVSGYQDTRIIWYGVHLLAWLLLLVAVAPRFPSPPRELRESRRRPWHWLALLIAPFVAAALLALLAQFVEVNRLGGLLVGGALAVWFLILGLIWLFAGFRVPAPGGRALPYGLLLFVLLWIAFGALAQFVWLPWLLIPARLLLWPFIAVALLPWMLASALAGQNAGAGRRFLWWLFQSALIVAGLLVTLLLVPSLFFLALLLPLVPLILAILAVAGAAVKQPWAVAIGGALFFAWLIAAVFPLAA